MERQAILEVAEIFQVFEIQFLSIYGNVIRNNELKAFNAIKNCRTSALGGHLDKCNHCGFPHKCIIKIISKKLLIPFEEMLFSKLPYNS